ncbi:hypothetical protein OIU79_000707 [Salix purpurea]|uniref:Uncharacterized protein n=1 Tax=Salix purpurea TaxID=77065 RepID=A0A9Q0V1Z9_SALPP|nr:hypothetical protein OIU79_000707 [Salix purpurea]
MKPGKEGFFLNPKKNGKQQIEKSPGGRRREKDPSLTVLRNDAILKNIFVINKSPLASPASSEPSIENEENIQETEEILTFHEALCHRFIFRPWDMESREEDTRASCRVQ